MNENACWTFPLSVDVATCGSNLVPSVRSAISAVMLLSFSSSAICAVTKIVFAFLSNVSFVCSTYESLPAVSLTRILSMTVFEVGAVVVVPCAGASVFCSVGCDGVLVSDEHPAPKSASATAIGMSFFIGVEKVNRSFLFMPSVVRLLCFFDFS